MLFSDYAKNLLIYYNNLSTYYVICVFMSVTAIILTWFLHTKEFAIENATKATENYEQVAADEMDRNEEVNANGPEDSVQNIIASYKNTKKSTIEKMAAELTQDQLEEEKQAERAQLAAILELLKQQEDKFQVGSMEELEGQLKLYR